MNRRGSSSRCKGVSGRGGPAPLGVAAVVAHWFARRYIRRLPRSGPNSSSLGV
jgi:hypothetical protein